MSKTLQSRPPLSNAVRKARITTLLSGVNRVPNALPLSCEDTVNLIEQHLRCKSSSRLPVLIVAAAFKAAKAGLLGNRHSVTFRHDRLDNFFGQRWFFSHRLLRGFLALADQLTLELQPRAFLSACNLADHWRPQIKRQPRLRVSTTAVPRVSIPSTPPFCRWHQEIPPRRHRARTLPRPCRPVRRPSPPQVCLPAGLRHPAI